MKKKSKNQVYIPHQDKWNEHFPTPGKPNPNYYTDFWYNPLTNYKEYQIPLQK